MATGLSRLQEMVVWSCNTLEAIVAEKNVNDDGVHINDGVREEIDFAQLRKLNLGYLPKLKNFVSNGEIQNKRQKSLQESEIHREEEDDEEEEEEGELKSSLLFFTKVSCPKLEKFELSGISNLTEIWSHMVSENYCNLTELQINKCDSLKYMLTSYIAMGLVRLRSLEVRDCAGMKHLVVEEEKGETNIKTIIFPQLSSICLDNLPNLTTFYSEMGLNENLDTATQPLFNEKVSFPRLEKLVLSEILNLTEIWSHKFQEILCCNLTIYKCKSMKHVFLSSVAPSLNKLEYLRVEDCEVMKTVIGDENRENEEIIKTSQHEHVAATFVFAKLAEVCLKKLPKMECLYPREHTIKCPSWMDLKMDDCGKLSVFDFLSFPHKHEAEIHDQTAEPTKEPQICKHVVDEISEQGTFTENAIEPRMATEISEDSAEKSVKLEVRELAPLLPSTNHIEAAAQAPKNLAKAQNDATNVDKMADTFETGKGKEHLKHPMRHLVHSEIKSPPRTSSSIHFIPLLSEFLQIIQNQPLKSMSAEHVQFMENAFRDLSTMNFSIEWFIPYVQKARECLPVLESRREISELESEIAKMEAELEAAREKKKALEEKYEGVASRIDLDKSLHDST